MFKKAILSAFAALALMFAANAPASAAMAVAKPEAAQTGLESQIVKVRLGGHRGGFRHGGFRRHGGWHRGRWHRRHGWHRGRWHRRHGRYHRWHRRYYRYGYYR
jgi:hypothetical protein